MNSPHFVFSEKIGNQLVELVNLQSLNNLIEDIKLAMVVFQRNGRETKSFKRIGGEIFPELLHHGPEKMKGQKTGEGRRANIPMSQFLYA